MAELGPNRSDCLALVLVGLSIQDTKCDNLAVVQYRPAFWKSRWCLGVSMEVPDRREERVMGGKKGEDAMNG